jgi:hypothetical protein
MIAQRFEFTRDFPKAWNNSVYFQLRKMSCGFKDQARFCPSGEKCGLGFEVSYHLVQFHCVAGNFLAGRRYLLHAFTGMLTYFIMPLYLNTVSQAHIASLLDPTMVTSGTLFHATKLPLTKWFWAIYWISSDKGGISALRLSKLVGVSWRSAYRVLRMIILRPLHLYLAISGSFFFPIA